MVSFRFILGFCAETGNTSVNWGSWHSNNFDALFARSCLRSAGRSFVVAQDCLKDLRGFDLRILCFDSFEFWILKSGFIVILVL